MSAEVSTSRYAHTMFARVAVDKFDITSGPGSDECKRIERQLVDADTVTIQFCLRTLASEHGFSRTIVVTSLESRVDLGSYKLEGTYEGQKFSGWYDSKTRRGWFRGL